MSQSAQSAMYHQYQQQQPHHLQSASQYNHQAYGQQQQQQYGGYPSHSVMEDASDDDDEQYQHTGEHDHSFADSHLDAEGEDDVDMEDEEYRTQVHSQADFYRQQRQQAMYYQHHQQQHAQASSADGHVGYPQRTVEMGRYTTPVQEQVEAGGKVAEGENAENDSDEESSIASIPDEDIDFSLNHALRTFQATVPGQASVTKGDPLLLIDDANAYWWLVRVLKTEALGYLPAENVETPFERLARLNKFRNVDLALATAAENQASIVQDREKIKNMLAAKAKSLRGDKASAAGRSGSGDSGGRRVAFAPPTYVEAPVTTWSDDEDEDGSSDEEGEYEGELEETERNTAVVSGAGSWAGRAGERRREEELAGVERSLADMEPDDGVEWADSAAQETQRRQMEQRAAQQIGRGPPPPQTNNPYAMRQASQTSQEAAAAQVLDPAQAGDTRKVSVTPSVASESGQPAQATMANRQVSNVSNMSTTSVVSAGSAASGPTSPGSEDKKSKSLLRKSSKDDLGDGSGEKKKRGVLSGLFSRNKGKDKKDKGISSQDARTSEDSTISSPGRHSEDGSRRNGTNQATSPQSSASSALRLQQREQAMHQAYANQYLANRSDIHSPSTAEAAAAVAQSAAAMRLAVSMASGSKRPSSIILSPNPAGPPLLNVLRIFAGDNVHSEASFKTVLLNETTSSTDLIKQAMQRFHLPSRTTDAGQLYLTVRNVQGEEMELTPDEKPLIAFQEAVQRWSSDDVGAVNELTPRVKRSSVSSLSSVASLSNHPAIQKLGMSDYSDDSVVKIYLNRRDPSQAASDPIAPQLGLPSIKEDAPGVHARDDAPPPASPPTGKQSASPRYNPHLTVGTGGSGSPERYSSPSAKFAVQLVIRPTDLPDTSTFDPSSEAIIPRSVLRDRLAAGHPSVGNLPMDSRKRVFMLPRNATVLEAIEQGLEKFGITEGVADGGDDVEDKASKRRSMVRVRYSLVAMVGSEERPLHPSSKIIDAYKSPPVLKPVEKMTMAEKRRSRDISSGGASHSDILPSDPVFVLKRMGPRATAQVASRLASAAAEHSALYRQNAPPPITTPASTGGTDEPVSGPMSPQEIVAAQRAAIKANQRAIISAYANQSQGVDVIVPDRGTVRSSRLLEPAGGKQVVRYSFIDGAGETYDISDLLAEELKDEPTASQARQTGGHLLGKPPQITRQATDSSAYVTAPSTPFEDAPEEQPDEEKEDLLRGIIERSRESELGDKGLEERLRRVINQVNVKGKASTSSEDTISAETPRTPRQADRSFGSTNDETPRRPSVASVSTVGSKGQNGSGSPAAPRSASRQADYQTTAASVKKIISRHRQQPSIASIMSDLSATASATRDDDTSASGSGSGSASGGGLSASTRATTATPSDLSVSPRGGPIRPFGAVYVRSVSASSGPPPSAPVKYKDDFGMKALMAIVQARAANEKHDLAASRSKRRPGVNEPGSDNDEVQRVLYGERPFDRSDEGGEEIHPDVKACFEPMQARLDAWDREIDNLLSMLAVPAR